MTVLLTDANGPLDSEPAPVVARRRKMRHEKQPVVNAVQMLLLLLYGVPIAWILLTSLKAPGDVVSIDKLIFFEPTFQAYATAFQSRGLLEAASQSLMIATGTTAIVLLLATPLAYAIARVGNRAYTAILGALIVLQMVPQTATVIPLFQVFNTWGLLDNVFGLILADAAHFIPFATLLLRAFFRSVPIELEEAASVDGASRSRTFLTIVIPVARNGLTTVGTLIFMLSWGEFLYAINFLLSPGSYPLSALLAQQVSAFGINWPVLMALAVMASIPTLLLFLCTYRLLREGLTVGAVK